jgi:hypothetical protein
MVVGGFVGSPPAFFRDRINKTNKYGSNWRRGRDSPPVSQNARVSAGLLILFLGRVYPTRVSLATVLSASKPLAVWLRRHWRKVRLPPAFGSRIRYRTRFKPDRKADARHPRAKPPSIGITAPVTKSERSVARNSTTLAQSSIVPSRRRATNSARSRLLWLLPGMTVRMIRTDAITPGRYSSR